MWVWVDMVVLVGKCVLGVYGCGWVWLWLWVGAVVVVGKCVCGWVFGGSGHYHYTFTEPSPKTSGDRLHVSCEQIC